MEVSPFDQPIWEQAPHWELVRDARRTATSSSSVLTVSGEEARPDVSSSSCWSGKVGGADLGLEGTMSYSNGGAIKPGQSLVRIHS